MFHSGGSLFRPLGGSYPRFPLYFKIKNCTSTCRTKSNAYGNMYWKSNAYGKNNVLESVDINCKQRGGCYGIALTPPKQNEQKN